MEAEETDERLMAILAVVFLFFYFRRRMSD